MHLDYCTIFFNTIEKISLIINQIYLYLINNESYSEEIYSLVKEIDLLSETIDIKIKKLNSFQLKDHFEKNRNKILHDINSFVASIKMTKILFKKNGFNDLYIRQIKLSLLKIFID